MVKRTFLAGTVFCVLLWVPQARAANFSVTRSADTNDGVCDADCSLREAISAANANPGSDTISLPDGIYSLSGLSNDDANASGDLDVTDDLTINGTSQDGTIIDAGGNDRVLHHLGPDGTGLTLSRLTIRAGNAGAGNGGGVYIEPSYGQLNIDHCTISGNQAAIGGGIFLNGEITQVTSSKIINNTATDSAGGLEMQSLSQNISISDSLIDGNTAPHIGGAGINGALLVTILNANVTYNSATINPNAYSDPEAGGLYLHLPLTGQATIQNSHFDHNQAIGICGGLCIDQAKGIDISDSTMNDNVVDNTIRAGGLFCNVQGPSAHCNLTNTQIMNNDVRVGGAGGAMLWAISGINNSIHIVGSEFSNNTVDFGSAGAMWIDNHGDLTITKSKFQDNHSLQVGGLLVHSDTAEFDEVEMNGNTAKNYVGGLDAHIDDLTITNSSISNNQVTAGDFGGMRYDVTAGNLTMSNVTVSGNQVPSGSQAAGFYFNAPGGGRGGLTSVTIADNHSDQPGTNLSIHSGTVLLKNSIVSGGGSGASCFVDGTGVLTSGGFNVEDGTSCGLTQSSDQNADPLLMPLADNGGDTLTHNLMIGSPAIDKGDPASCPGADQRGITRLFDGDFDGMAVCDIGALEFNSCGDGVVQAGLGEACDDGNQDNTDDCLNSCVVASCGDGHLHAGIEECDDGNMTDGDGCSSDCRLEPASRSPPPPPPDTRTDLERANPDIDFSRLEEWHSYDLTIPSPPAALKSDATIPGCTCVWHSSNARVLHFEDAGLCTTRLQTAASGQATLGVIAVCGTASADYAQAAMVVAAPPPSPSTGGCQLVR